MIIHSHVNDPRSPSFFKREANEKATSTTIDCSRSADCDLYKKGGCHLLSLFGSCPYGRLRKETGPTKTAKSCGKWVSDHKAQNPGVPSLSYPSLHLVRVGEYVLIDFYFLRDLTPKWTPYVDFTVELLRKICDHRPRDCYHSEILSFQRDDLPKFLRELKTTFPEKYLELSEVYPRVFQILGDKPNVGRKARLSTLNPNVGVFKDIHGGEWIWDGVYATSQNAKVSFGLTNSYQEVRLRPKIDAVVEISNEGQVNENTEFLS